MPRKTFEASLRLPTMNLKDAVILDLHGEINGGVEAALNAVYEQAEEQKPNTIMLNFSDVDYMNSTGIALIVGLLAKARKAHRMLTVYGLSDHYLELFNITRLVDFMNVVSDEQSAVTSILSPKGQ